MGSLVLSVRGCPLGGQVLVAQAGWSLWHHWLGLGHLRQGNLSLQSLALIVQGCLELAVFMWHFYHIVIHTLDQCLIIWNFLLQDICLVFLLVELWLRCNKLFLCISILLLKEVDDFALTRVFLLASILTFAHLRHFPWIINHWGELSVTCRFIIRCTLISIGRTLFDTSSLIGAIKTEHALWWHLLECHQMLLTRCVQRHHMSHLIRLLLLYLMLGKTRVYIEAAYVLNTANLGYCDLTHDVVWSGKYRRDLFISSWAHVRQHL